MRAISVMILGQCISVQQCCDGTEPSPNQSLLFFESSCCSPEVIFHYAASDDEGLTQLTLTR